MINSNKEAISRARAISGIENVTIISKNGKSEKQNAISNLISSYLPSISVYYSDLIQNAGLDRKYQNLIIILSSAVIVGLIFIIIFSKQLIFAILFLVFLIQPSFFLKKRIFARADNFEKDYAAFLVSLASAVRTGLDPIVAFTQLESLFEVKSELRKSLALSSEEIAVGHSEEQVISAFASDIQHPDIQLFRTAFLLARREGSSLGDCLHRLARVTRQRQSFRRKIRSAVAMQKLSAFGITGCAVAIGIIQYMSNQKAMIAAINHPIASKILMAGVTLIFLGIFWMLNMARSKL